MAKHRTAEERRAALQALADSGCNYGAVSAETGIPIPTLHTWRRRYDLPEPAEVDTDPEVFSVVPADPCPPPLSAPPPARLPLYDLPRAEYLADRILLLDRALGDVLGGSNPTWSAVRPLVQAQSDMHRERVEVIRAEGNQLDLSADPLALARGVEAASALIAMLTVDLDTDPEP